MKDRCHWGDQDVDGRIILRWIFRKLEGVVGTGWSRLRIGTGGGHLWVRWGSLLHGVSNFFFRKSCLFEVMWKNMVQSDRPHMKICCMCLVCWIHKATNTQSAYVILVAFPTQLLHERLSMLCYTYIAYLTEVWFITNKFWELIYCSFIDTNSIHKFLYKLHKIKFLYTFRASSAHLQEVNDVNCTRMQPLVFSFSAGHRLVQVHKTATCRESLCAWRRGPVVLRILLL